MKFPCELAAGQRGTYNHLEVYAGKPIIGMVGGIGSGKSFVADLFGELGCLVIHSDKLVEDAYNAAPIQGALREWWGGSVFQADGRIDRKSLADRIFSDPGARSRLEGLLHPLVDARRRQLMDEADLTQCPAFVWDTPLLVETGLHRQCDSIIYVAAPTETRLKRLAVRSGWDTIELSRRENLQQPLDTKRKMSDYEIENTADAAYARGQVKDVLSRIRGRSQ